MNKLLVICGATATGKTKLAFDLAKKFNGELISADSRMVYKFMDIGTGKDKDKYGEILGYDLINPDEEFSISQYAKFVNKKIKEILEKGKLPILVGGSGLYIKAMTENIDTVDIPRDLKLREEFKDKTADGLFEILKRVDIKKAESMNGSDRKNPRRLIRAIEIISIQKYQDIKILRKRRNCDVLWIGLEMSMEDLKRRIEKRVDERIRNGFEKEYEFLKKKDFLKYVPSKTPGYKNWPDITQWKKEEIAYAKRQMTWFKKEKKVSWFDVTESGFEKSVEKLVIKWYSLANATKN